MIFKRLLFMVALQMGIFTQSNAQQIGTGITTYFGSGLSNDAGYCIELSSNPRFLQLVLRAEARSFSWGNFVGYGGGARYSYFYDKRLVFGIKGLGLMGWTLFKDQNFKSYGISLMPLVQYNFTRRSSVLLQFGTRISWCPDYAPYGVNYQLDFPVGFMWQISLGKLEEKAQ
ncbi:hypothetical protein GC194_10500 [bacterium]|nr:hypothetical protein [bacterium]